MNNKSYLYVDSDADWFIENNNDWIQASRFPDNNGHIIQIQVENNTIKNDRNASFSLVSEKNSKIKVDIIIKQRSKYYFGEEYTDLGLPSGTMWAVKNLGANNISNYGWEFGWGEIEPKENDGNYDNRFFDKNTRQFSKYVLDEESGRVDSLEFLDAIDDAASQLLGGKWRIPTKEEVLELKEYVIKDKNSVYYKFDSNEESIIFPTSAYSSYWTNTLYKTDRAYTLQIVNGISLYYEYRINRVYIRPVFRFEKKIIWPTLEEIERVQDGNIKIENYEEDENWN